MKLSDYRTDGLHRAAFYHEHGFLPALPTPEQIRVGIRSMGLPNKLRYWRDTLIQQVRSRTFAQHVVRHGDGLFVDGTPVSTRYDAFETLPAYKRLLSIPAVRGPVLALLCPEYAFAGRGLRIGTNLVVNHLLYLPHAGIGPVWDLQLIVPDPGGLDLLEERLEIARRGKGLRGRLYRAVAEAGGDIGVWYETLSKLIPACRGLEFPESRHEPTLVEFLHRCSEIEPRDYEFFRTRNVTGKHPQIGWPRSPLPEPPVRPRSARMRPAAPDGRERPRPGPRPRSPSATPSA